MRENLIRTEALLGADAVRGLRQRRVLLFGVGGVGSACAEALCRGGVGRITMVDPDTVCESNLNRQLVATVSSLGRGKAEAMAERMRDINPDCIVETIPAFYSAENEAGLDFGAFDYVADAIDTVSSKLLLIQRCRESHTPVISSMGTGGKLHPELLRLGDIYETQTCPLARVMRRELRRMGIDSLPCVWSPEEPVRREDAPGVIGTVSFVPPVAGFLMAGAIIRALVGVN